MQEIIVDQHACATDMPPRKNRWLFGLDLGQSKDYTALAIIDGEGEGDAAKFAVRALKRYPLGTAYPDIVSHVSATLERDEFKGERAQRPLLAVDQTGVGAPVVDLFKKAKPRADLWPILITGGDTESHEHGVRRVPKRHLVSVVQVLLQSGRLTIAAKDPEAPTLAAELENFQTKITTSANEQFGAWREGTHDDLVLAVALAVYSGSVPRPLLTAYRF
jgi:hypothetical protein